MLASAALALAFILTISHSPVICQEPTVPGFPQSLQHAATLHSALSSQEYRAALKALTVELVSTGTSLFEEVHRTGQLPSALTDAWGSQSSVAAPNITVSPICQAHLQLIIQSLMSEQLWALAMLDAFGKPASGILTGALKWQGSYSECKEIKLEIPTVKEGHIAKYQEIFQGQYCMTTLQVPIQALYNQPVSIGMCLPSTCSTLDVINLVNGTVALLGNTTHTQSTYCQPVEPLALDTPAIAVISVFSFLGFLLVVATLYDIFIYQPSLRPPLTSPPTPDASPINHDAGVGGASGVETPTSTSSEIRTTLDVNEYTPLLKTGGGMSPEEYKKSVEANIRFPIKVLLAFSAYTNGGKLLNVSRPAEGNLAAIHGVRLFSMTWVLLGHAFSFPLTYADNVLVFLKWVKDWSFQAILNATVSVDSFFLLSGTLVSYLLLRELHKRGGIRKVSWPKFYFHRFWRLTPPYMLMLGFFTAVLPFMGEGPKWPWKFIAGSCADKWWTNLLYINNFFSQQEQCYGWAWYLANDMQFFIISPIFIIPLFLKAAVGLVLTVLGIIGSCVCLGVLLYVNDYPAEPPVIVANLSLMKHGVLGVILAVAGIIGSCVTLGVITRIHNYPPEFSVIVGNLSLLKKPLTGILLTVLGMTASCVAYGVIVYKNYYPSDEPVFAANISLVTTNWFDDTYIKPWCRIGPYLVGVLLGYALYKTANTTRKLHWSLVVLGWLMAAGFCLSVLYGLTNVARGHMYSWELNAFYGAVHRTVWAIGLAWLIFACCRGYGGPVNTILSWPALVPLSRLTYMAYLVHPIIIVYYLATMEVVFHVSYQSLIWFFLGSLLMTYGFSVVLSLLLEAPMIAIEKLLLPR